MSHVTDVRVRVRSIDDLRDALPPELELRDKQTFCWWGNFMNDSTPPAGRNPRDYGKCDFAIGYKGVTPSNGPSGEWEIGVCKALDGDGYDLLMDDFGGPGAKLRKHVPAIKHNYACGVAEKSALAKLSRDGWRATRLTHETDPTVRPGHTRIRLRKR
jgi:hypothetical protein